MNGFENADRMFQKKNKTTTRKMKQNKNTSPNNKYPIYSESKYFAFNSSFANFLKKNKFVLTVYFIGTWFTRIC